jgi:hypothetical protein
MDFPTPTPISTFHQMTAPPTITAIHQTLLAAVDNDTTLISFPTSPFYAFHDAKPYNLNIPITPIAVAYPLTARHVSSLVLTAAQAGLKVQPRSGGHSYGNYSLGAASVPTLCIDLKNLQTFSMDTSTWHAKIGAGTLLDDVTKRLYDHGKRAMAHGVCPQVGCGGHFTIGGFGPMSRMWGTALDHVIGATVVLADGRIISVSDSSPEGSEEKDVFFAVRGAAASFGVVTEFVVRTHPAPEEIAIRYSFAFEIGGVLGGFRALAPTFKRWIEMCRTPDLDRRLYTQITLFSAGMMVTGTFFGPQADFDALKLEDVFPAHTKRNVLQIRDWLGLVGHWTEDLGLRLVGGQRISFYSKCLAFKSGDVPETQAVDKLFAYLDEAKKGTPLWFLNFELQGGATNDVPREAAAYAHRDVLLYSESFGIDLVKVSDTTVNFLTGINKTITDSMPGREWGSYPGYVDPKLPNGQVSYWGENLPRLERIKRRVDPGDVFHNPQSVGAGPVAMQKAEEEARPGCLSWLRGVFGQNGRR